MEFANRRLRVVVVALGLLGFTGFGCIAQKAQKAPPATNEVLLKTPTREILVTDGDLNKPYDILGEVECTLTGKSLSSMVSHGSSKEIKDMLRKVAFTKYGERVDAIINTKTIDGIDGGGWGAMGLHFGAKTGTVSAHGIAVHFK